MDSEYLNPLSGLVVCCLTPGVLGGGQICSTCEASSVYSAGYESYWKMPLRHLDGIFVWTTGSLEEVMAVSSPGMHAIAYYSHHVLLGGPPPLFSMKELAVVSADKCFYLK